MDDVKVSSGGSPLDGLRVLIVDDDEDIRTSERMVLEHGGAIVTDAPSALLALALLRHELPDVLLSDLSMPIHDGHWLIHQVRQLSPEAGGTTPAAAVTGRVESEDRARTLHAGFQAHLSKSGTPASLIAAVARLARASGAAGVPT